LKLALGEYLRSYHRSNKFFKTPVMNWR